MASPIRLIAVDMDGTFLRSAGSYDRDRFVRVLGRIREAQVHFVVASGNPYPQLTRFFDPKDQVSFVAENGAHVVSAGVVRHLQTLGVAEVARVIEVLDGLPEVDYLVCGVDGAYVPSRMTTRFRQRMEFFCPILTEVSSVAEVSTPLFNFFIQDEAGISAELVAWLRAMLPESVVPVVSGPTNLDLLPLGVNKARGLEVLLQRFGVSWAEVAAFGDANNDLEMLASAAFGCAMANATPEVLAVASLRTKTNDEDGVLVQLENWFG